MERLTKYYSGCKCYFPFSLADWNEQKAINKLGELEDVLEKWHIEDLDKFLEEQIAKKRELNDILWKIEQELAELKQKAIVPKFKVGQEIHVVCDSKRIVSGWKIADYEYYKKRYVIKNKNGIDWIREDRIFATKEEAEQKLAEIGEKDE